MNKNEDKYWLKCPVCKGKTRIMIREDTVLANFPLYCPKCKHDTLISIKSLQVTIIKKPDAKTQS